MRHLDVLDGAQVLGQLRQRSGILRSPAEDRVDFVHRCRTPDGTPVTALDIPGLHVQVV
ncbi:hypothetical protein [Streptomyces sp. CMB-StM0423]|uniref:hypothetical protein n=1 Tax=Streptomyces sp. CMB-StM0423 TaxID=2059884 RepID=UPI001F3F148A|nr:hypothetical protein [Streptomyces sp. CMB-StM0423]